MDAPERQKLFKAYRTGWLAAGGDPNEMTILRYFNNAYPTTT